MSNYLLKYKTFDELYAEVLVDFKKYATNGMIDSAELIKVAQKINKRLGDKLRKEKEIMLYVEKGRVRLPIDFHRHTSAAMCYDYKVTHKVVAGDQREYISVCRTVPVTECEESCTPCKPCVRLNQCGDQFEIIETTLYETRSYREIGKIEIKNSKPIMPMCADSSVAYIENHFLYTNFDEGKIYLSYLGNMEDEDGNLIVLDHEMINPYYEYSLKRQIIENLILNGETIPQASYQIVETRYKEARVEADSLINMPDFREMEMVQKANRQAMYRKYYYIFK